MDGSNGTGGTTGPKESASGQLIAGGVARTQGMSRRSNNNAAEAIDDVEQTQPGPPDEKDFLIVIPGPKALTPWEKRAADAGPWPVRLHFPSVAAADAFSKRAAPIADFEGLPYLLTAQEVARILRTTVGAIYARVERGRMPGVVRRGRKLLFHRDAVRRVLDREAAGNARGSK